MFSFTVSHDALMARCERNGEGFGSNARMYAEIALEREAELAWAREVIAAADADDA